MIIDDHPLFCDALCLTLRAVTGIEAINVFDRLEPALSAAQDGPAPDVIVLDLNLPDVTGLDGLIRLHRSVPQVPLVVVSSMADHRIICAAIRAGASGFVPKHSQRDTFRAAFHSVALGQTWLPDNIDMTEGAEVPVTDREDAVARLRQLTRQQGTILQLICEGKLNKQIAYDLSIAETTVKAHITAIMRKLSVQSRTQAVLIAQEASYSNLLQKTP
ncbi:MAG: response regulator transcription factor [Alphaproteobacteria bacterium]|nr:response regulator transcription factor [Alphaproteobacteria bacterium]